MISECKSPEKNKRLTVYVIVDNMMKMYTWKSKYYRFTLFWILCYNIT